MNDSNNKRTTTQQIAKQLLIAKRKLQMSNEPELKYYKTVYYDGLWEVEVVMPVNNKLSWYITHLDSKGNHNKFPFAIARTQLGNIEYYSNFPVKKLVIKRIIRLYEILEEVGVAV